MIIWGEITSLFDKEIEGNRSQTFNIFFVCVKKVRMFMGRQVET